MAAVLEREAWQNFRANTMLNGGEARLQKSGRVQFDPENPEHLSAAKLLIQYKSAPINFILVPPYTGVRQMVLEVLVNRYLGEVENV